MKFAILVAFFAVCACGPGQSDDDDTTVNVTYVNPGLGSGPAKDAGTDCLGKDAGAGVDAGHDHCRRHHHHCR